MKILQITVIIVITLSVFGSTPVLAHSGRTDGDGGHYDHSTGEYHYHHGYPAHQHKNGECPYRFDDKTGQDSGGNGGSLKGGYGGGSSGGGSSSISSNDAQPLTTVLTLLGAALFGFVIWVSWNSHKDKKKPYTPPPEPDSPKPPSPRMNPVRLVSPDPEPTEPLDPKTQTVTLPIVRKPRPDPDSVLTVEDIMPPSLKKIPPSNLSAIDPNHHTFAMREVKSSSIHSIGYSNGTLTVCFHSGREYIYFDVSISEYFSFINAPSVGKYYNKHIRQKYHGDFVGIKDSEAPKTTNPT